MTNDTITPYVANSDASFTPAHWMKSPVPSQTSLAAKLAGLGGASGPWINAKTVYGVKGDGIILTDGVMAAGALERSPVYILSAQTAAFSSPYLKST